jgi:hypothetical protein
VTVATLRTVIVDDDDNNIIIICFKLIKCYTTKNRKHVTLAQEFKQQ